MHWFVEVFVIYPLYNISLRMATRVAETCELKAYCLRNIRYFKMFMCICWFNLISKHPNTR